MSRIAAFCEWLLRSPLLWGGMAWLLLNLCVANYGLGGPIFAQYLQGHPIEWATTLLFCIAIADLALRAVGLLPQWLVLDRALLDPVPKGGVSVDDAPVFVEQLEQVPALYAKSYLVERLRSALEYVRTKDTADSLEKHLRYLEQADLDRMHSGYALTRVLMWAIPILGFLGTVVGITDAIKYLRPDKLEESLGLVTGSLGVAFDTTTLSLLLSLFVALAKFGVERVEQTILSGVDRRTDTEMLGRFQQYGTTGDPQVATVRRMCEQVTRAVESMATRQANVLRDTLEEGHRHWADVATSAGRILDQSFATTLNDSLERHAQTLSIGTERQVESLRMALRGQVELVSTAADRQVAALSQGVAQTVAALEVAVAQRIDGTTKLLDKQIAAAGALVDKQLTELRLGVTTSVTDLQGLLVSQSQQVRGETAELLGKVNEGLERMAELLVEALQKHGETLTAGEMEIAQENRRHLSEVEAALGEAMVVAADRQEKLIGQSEHLLNDLQRSLASAAAATIEQQQQLQRQGELLLKVVDATGHVRQLEQALSDNLSTLGRAHNFEETLLSLSAAIQLLSARMGHGQAPSRGLGFDWPTPGSHQAA